MFHILFRLLENLAFFMTQSVHLAEMFCSLYAVCLSIFVLAAMYVYYDKI